MKMLLIAGGVFVIGLLALLVLKRARANEVATDERVIQQLRDAGADLTKPAAHDFFLYLPDEAAARKAAERAHRDGDTVNVQPSAVDGDSQWVCQITRRMVPDLRSIQDIGRELTAIANDLGGEYDGWGAEVVQ